MSILREDKIEAQRHDYSVALGCIATIGLSVNICYGMFEVTREIGASEGSSVGLRRVAPKMLPWALIAGKVPILRRDVLGFFLHVTSLIMPSKYLCHCPCQVLNCAL